jgi:hypothetical protein
MAAGSLHPQFAMAAEKPWARASGARIFREESGGAQCLILMCTNYVEKRNPNHSSAQKRSNTGPLFIKC